MAADPCGAGTAIRFAGYAARFDRIDNGGDVVRKGAFSATIAAKRAIPLLWQHKPGVVIGNIDQVREDARGLRVIGSIRAKGLSGQVANLVREGRIDGLSFGYRVRDCRKRDGVRELLSLDLLEVSVVRNPMQPLARVHAVES